VESESIRQPCQNNAARRKFYKDYEEGRERRRLERGPAKALNFEKNFLQNFQTKESEQTKKRSKVLKALLNFNTAPCPRSMPPNAGQENGPKIRYFG
jgi:hypothetical protein